MGALARALGADDPARVHAIHKSRPALGPHLQTGREAVLTPKDRTEEYKDRLAERIAIMREANNIPDDQETPEEMKVIAMSETVKVVMRKEGA